MDWPNHSITPTNTVNVQAFRQNDRVTITLGVTEAVSRGHRVFGVIEDGVIRGYAASRCLHSWDPYDALSRESTIQTSYPMGPYRIPFQELRRAFLELGLIDG